MPKTIILATKNEKKVNEIKQMAPKSILSSYHLTTAPSGEIDWQEDAPTFAGNALIKAQAFADALEQPVLADDSGICLDSLSGAPGVISKRYSGPDATDQDNNDYLLSQLAQTPAIERSGHFFCCLCYLAPGQKPKFFTGAVRGHLAESPRGPHGFGYDPLFIPLGYQQTFGELDPSVKYQLSHRSRALRAWLKWLATA